MHVTLLATETARCSWLGTRNMPTFNRPAHSIHLWWVLELMLLSLCLLRMPSSVVYLGVTLAGAGGGGFLVALGRTSSDARKCEELIKQENIPNVSLYSAQIDRHGPAISFA